MSNYNPKSMKAEEFISHEEITDTLRYADENKDNLPLLREILEKAKERKKRCGNDKSNHDLTSSFGVAVFSEALDSSGVSESFSFMISGFWLRQKTLERSFK